MIVSVTRLHVRSARLLPPFFFWALRSTIQVRRAAGCIRGATGNESLTGYWTMTGWEGVEAMQEYRNAAPHLRAMRHLLDWCDEASFARWEQTETSLPDSTEARRRLSSSGRTSKVAHPSARHAAGECVGPALPRFGYRFDGPNRRHPA